MKKALVTGGTGFIGSKIVISLVNRGYDVTSFDCTARGGTVEGVKYVLGDVRDVEALKKAGENASYIFHAAGVLGTSLLLENVPRAAGINIMGGVNVLELAKANNATMVNLGLIPQWNSPYMVTKHVIEKLGVVYNESFGTDVRTAQLTHAYGPRQSPYQAKAIPNFIIKALLGQDIVLFGEEGGEFKYMDLIFSEDAGNALAEIAECSSLAGRILQLGSGEGWPVDVLARKIISMCQSESKIIYKPMRSGEPKGREKGFQHADLTEWHRHFSFPPTKVSLEEGLRRSIEGYRDDLRVGRIDLSRVIDG